MDEKLYRRLCEDVAANRSALVNTIIRLVNIKSVKSEPLPGAPFGDGPRKILDTVLEMGKDAGFYTEIYDDVFVSLAMKAGPVDLGIWCHGDVVAEGGDWLYEPYDAVEYKDCVIGRGATDNKGQLAAIFHLMKILKARNVELPFNLALFVGSNEEEGMEDLKAFLRKYPQPKLNLVPDGGFPVAFSGAGGFRVWIESEQPLPGISIEGGHADAPGVVRAVLADGREIMVEEAPAHNAKRKTDNMFAKLLEQLPQCDAIRYVSEIAHSPDGRVFGVTHEDEDFGATIVRIKEMTTVNGRVSANVIFRYPFGITDGQMRSCVEASAKAHGFRVVRSFSTVPPFKYPKDDPYLNLLWESSEEVIGSGKEPFTEKGGTYAHWLKNGYIFGMNGCLRPEGFPEGRGGAHGRDELVCISRLQRAMRIYTRVLLKLKDRGL